MKSVNAVLRKHYHKIKDDATKSPFWPEFKEEIEAANGGELSLNELCDILTANPSGRATGYERFMLSNNLANIKRLKSRIAELEKSQQRDTREEKYTSFTLRHNAQENRIQFIFDRKPASETRDILKKSGFRWAPSNNAWQRQWTPNAEWVTKRVIEDLTD